MSTPPLENRRTPPVLHARGSEDLANAIQTANTIHVLQRQTDAKLHIAQELLASRTGELASMIALLRATLDADPDGIVVMNRAGRIVAHNARFSAIWSLTADALHDVDYASLLPRMTQHIENAEAFAAREMHRHSHRLLETEQREIIELRDGRVFERHAMPQRIDGEVVGTVFHWRDISETRRAEQAQRLLDERLRQSQTLESIGALAGGIAHDFNNVLGAILGNTELALANLNNENREALDCLLAIRQASERASNLVQQILTLSRQQAHELRPVQLGAVVQEGVRLLQATVPAGIQLVTQIDHSAPVVLADEGQVHQVLLNLCANALRALRNRPDSTGRAGRIEIVVTQYDGATECDVPTVGTLPKGIGVALRFSDNGIGMAPNTRARIFEPFFSTHTLGESTGMGLSVVHGIMDVHHGAIRVDSAPNQGTTFTLYFPSAPLSALVTASAVAPDSQAVVGPPIVEHSRAVQAGTAAPPHVLYVDDDPMLVTIVTRTLQHAGYRVTGMRSAAEALDGLVNQHVAYDIIISDFNMPELSGLDLARKVRELFPTTPVVIASGYITHELQKEAEKLGVREVLYKPELPKRLLPLVRQLIHHVTA